MDVTELARLERLDLADFLQTLDPEHWDHPTLCERWRVREVVAHVISYEEPVGARDQLRRLRAVGFRPDRLNDAALADHVDRSPTDQIAYLREHATPRGPTALFGGRVGLVDAMVHHQDLRRALGRPRTVPADRLAVALPFAVTAPPLRGFWRARGTRLVATDVAFAHGRGAEARGPGEAVLMTMAGRRGAAADLTGPGAETLRRRLG